MPEDKFTFKHTTEVVGEDGKTKKQTKTYTLPPASESSMKIPGWVVQEVVLDPGSQVAEMALQVHMLKVSTASDEAKVALREMEAGDMLRILSDWMGESEGSSQ